MNRDELRSRKEAGLLHSRSSGETRLFYPVDSTSGGTWFGVNNRGVILCLLNRYQAPETADPVSRGNIIPAALEKGDVDAVTDCLLSLDYKAYNPFDLFLATRKKVLQFSWDGEDYSQVTCKFKNWFMFSSSGMSTEEVIAFRQNFFSAWHQEIGKTLGDANEVLRGFHLIQIPGMESQSVLMEREMSHTKSVIQADLSGKEMTVKYMPDILQKSLDAPFADAHVEQLEIRKN